MGIQNENVAAKKKTDEKLVSSTEFDRALDCIGDNSKHALLYYLQINYNIFLDQSVVQYEELEKALYDLVGAGAGILLDIVKSNVAFQAE